MRVRNRGPIKHTQKQNTGGYKWPSNVIPPPSSPMYLQANLTQKISKCKHVESLNVLEPSRNL